MLPGNHGSSAENSLTPAPNAPAKPAPRTAAKAPLRKTGALNLAIMALVVPGLFCTVALPAYAHSVPTSTDGAQATAALTEFTTSNAQSLTVSADVATASANRDAFTATSPADLRRAQLAALAAQRATFSGPSVRALLANPPYPRFSLDQVVAVARQYAGVPYVYGGASPAGFDCSGFTQYVYAQFGVSLPHSSARQGAGGTAISAADALPGDLVVMDGGGHVGIYLGGGMMIDAPYPGRSVEVRAIYNPDHWFVRYGI